MKKKKRFDIFRSIRANYNIRAAEVRVLFPEGEKVIMKTKDAIEKAKEYGMDLIEISPNADPPVCKIVEIGKYKYELEKKSKESKKHQINITIKEMRMSPKIQEHDYQTKLNHIKDFLAHKHKVKVNILFKGREITHLDLGIVIAEKLKKDLKEFAQIENEAGLIGRAIIIIFAPISGRSGQ